MTYSQPNRNYTYTQQAQLRQAFKEQFAHLDFKKIKYGNKRTYNATTRTAFNDWIDALSKDGDISQELAQRVTLEERRKPSTKARKVTHIEAREWHRRGPGGMYNRVLIHFKDGSSEHLPMRGGAADYGLQRAAEWIAENLKHKNPDRLTGTRFISEVVKATYSTIPVSRERDL
jgi:hypothetical protein